MVCDDSLQDDSFYAIISVGLIVIIAFLYFVHYKVYKSQYYRVKYVHFSTGKKCLIYITFLIINLCIAPVLIFIFVLLFAQIFNKIF